MQVEYKKEWMDTYLWILPDIRVEESYVEKMLLHNQGGGRLEFSLQEKEGAEYFCYKVTGKKALNSIYAVMPIRERQIRGILGQLFETLENGREYLLCEEDFVLSPNYIFATFPQMDMEFCYVPGYGVPLREQLESLFEYLLNRVDYEDKPAVNLLYDCYMFCMKEKGGLAEIRRLLEKEKETEALIEVKEPQYAETYRSPSTPKKTAAVISPTPVSCQKEDLYEKKESQNTYVSWLTERLFHRRKKELSLVAEEKAEYRAEMPQGGVQPVRTVLRVENQQEDSERTVLLSAKRNPPVPELICEQTGEAILLTKFPFYMGSAGEYADFVPDGEGISRIHCCIKKKDGNYYLSDLNSVNGTYLNKQEVIPGKDMLLSANDEIRIVSQEFYVKFPCH